MTMTPERINEIVLVYRAGHTLASVTQDELIAAVLALANERDEAEDALGLLRMELKKSADYTTAGVDGLRAQRIAETERADRAETLLQRMREALAAILPWHDAHPLEPTDNPVINQCRDALAAIAPPPSYQTDDPDDGLALCPVCKTTQNTYAVALSPHRYYMVQHDTNGTPCNGSHLNRDLIVEKPPAPTEESHHDTDSTIRTQPSPEQIATVMAWAQQQTDLDETYLAACVVLDLARQRDRAEAQLAEAHQAAEEAIAAAQEIDEKFCDLMRKYEALAAVGPAGVASARDLGQR